MRTLSFTLATLALAHAGALVAQERATLGRSGADWFPLRVGATWSYARVDATGARSVAEVTCRGEARSGRTTAFELGVRSEAGGRYEYWRVDDQGVWRHAGYGDGDMPGLMGDAGARWLACPIGLETVWTWTQRLPPTLARQMGGEWDPREPAPYRAQILDVNAELEVPAGTYRTVCVQIDMQPDPGGFGQRFVFWFAPGVGPVRRETFTLDANTALLIERDELRAFTPGPERPADPIELAKAFVRADPARWPEGASLIEEVKLTPSNSATVSRFLRVRAGETQAVLRVHGDQVAPFDLESVADVQAFFTSESVTAAADRTPQHMELNQFSRLYFTLRAVLEGDDPNGVSMRSSRSSSSGGPNGIVRSGTFTSNRGEQLDMSFQNGKLEKLEYRPNPK